MRAQFTLRKMRFQPTQSAGQLGLFEAGPAVVDGEPCGQSVNAEAEDRADEPKPGAFWNGRIWVTDSDVGF